MSYTKSTVNLKLPQWEENDYPTWLTDVNQAFSNIDTNAGDQKASIETALSAASEARTLATEASNNTTSLSGEVNSVKSNVAEVRELATTASTTANSAMDIAEIAQDSAEQVANKTANIESNATKISHVVNGVTSGYTEYGQGFTSICSSNGTSKLDFDDSGNIVSRDNQNAIVFNSSEVLNRLAAVESKELGTNAFRVKLTVASFTCYLCGVRIGSVVYGFCVEQNGSAIDGRTAHTGSLSEDIGLSTIYLRGLGIDKYKRPGITLTINGISFTTSVSTISTANEISPDMFIGS